MLVFLNFKLNEFCDIRKSLCRNQLSVFPFFNMKTFFFYNSHYFIYLMKITTTF